MESILSRRLHPIDFCCTRWLETMLGINGVLPDTSYLSITSKKGCCSAYVCVNESSTHNLKVEDLLLSPPSCHYSDTQRVYRQDLSPARMPVAISPPKASADTYGSSSSPNQKTSWLPALSIVSSLNNGLEHMGKQQKSYRPCLIRRRPQRLEM